MFYLWQLADTNLWVGEESLGPTGQRDFLFQVTETGSLFPVLPAYPNVSTWKRVLVHRVQMLPGVCHMLQLSFSCYSAFLPQYLLAERGYLMFGREGYYFTWTFIFGGASNSILLVVLGSRNIARGTHISIQGKNKPTQDAFSCQDRNWETLSLGGLPLLDEEMQDVLSSSLWVHNQSAFSLTSFSFPFVVSYTIFWIYKCDQQVRAGKMSVHH